MDFEHIISLVLSAIFGGGVCGGGAWAYLSKRQEAKTQQLREDRESEAKKRVDAIQEWVSLLATAQRERQEIKDDLHAQEIRHEQDRTKWAEEHSKCLEANASLRVDVACLRAENTGLKDRVGQLEMQIQRIAEKS